MRPRQRTPTDPNSPLKSDQQHHRGDSLPILLLLLLLPWRLNPHNNLVGSLIGKKLPIQPSTSKYLVSKHRPPIATVLSSLLTRWSARAIKSFGMVELEARKLKYPNTGTESLLMGILVREDPVFRREGADIQLKLLF
ncbi:hypothetical protein CMV_029566 [Castanea mollissima]|uniref:Uncharacterized protein n=1 Tax=Castanea mollissima TaxID=60419 RepID=A0A8J4Q5U0_9ROSI|nr:hypothetical protein CMV_029566 [Castanea mollissima]